MLPARFMLDDLFDEKELKGMGMNADVYQKDNKYHVDVDIPGFNKEDIHIECHKGTITIKAETKETHDENKKYLRHERKYRKLERSFYFGDIDEDNIKADFKNGTLHLIIPEKVETHKKQILID